MMALGRPVSANPDQLALGVTASVTGKDVVAVTDQALSAPPDQHGRVIRRVPPILTEPHPGNSHFRELRARAEQVVIPPEILREWFVRQCAAVEARAQKLAHAIETNHRLLHGPDDPRWRDWWVLNARYEWLAGLDPERPGTLTLLREEQHVLVCQQHGIDGVGEQDWMAVGAPRGELTTWYEGLALRGLLDGGGAVLLRWERLCERCAVPQIQAYARILERNHREGVA